MSFLRYGTYQLEGSEVEKKTHFTLSNHKNNDDALNKPEFNIKTQLDMTHKVC